MGQHLLLSATLFHQAEVLTDSQYFVAYKEINYTKLLTDERIQ
jgi:hypothetical protein